MTCSGECLNCLKRVNGKLSMSTNDTVSCDALGRLQVADIPTTAVNPKPTSDVTCNSLYHDASGEYHTKSSMQALCIDSYRTNVLTESIPIGSTGVWSQVTDLVEFFRNLSCDRDAHFWFTVNRYIIIIQSSGWGYRLEDFDNQTGELLYTGGAAMNTTSNNSTDVGITSHYPMYRFVPAGAVLPSLEVRTEVEPALEDTRVGYLHYIVRGVAFLKEP